MRFLLLLLLTVTPLLHAQTVLHRPATLENTGGTLHGSLLLPKSDQPVPVALLIAGSGPTDRNGNNPLGNNGSLLRLAQGLAQRGIASVRYDKRGIAASLAAGRDERQLSVQGYAADAADWVRQLRADPRFSSLVLIGHSEGALIASLAAQQVKVDGLILIAGSGRPIDEVLIEQLRTRQPAALQPESLQLIRQLKAGHVQEQVSDELQVLFRPSVQPYLISLFREDPAVAFAKTKEPALIVQGTTDIQISLDDARRLKAARPDADVLVISGMNHVLRIVAADLQQQLASYQNPDAPLAGELIPALARFIGQVPASSPEENGR
ncbi:alpha/beta hydrolase [Pseudomonas sp. Marseille-Q8238]